MFAQSVGPSDLYPRAPGVVITLWLHTIGIVVDRVPATAEHMFLARYVRLSLHDMQVSMLRSVAMNGVTADEVGRSINATGSRNTGTTVCLIRLGAVIPSGIAIPTQSKDNHQSGCRWRELLQPRNLREHQHVGHTAGCQTMQMTAHPSRRDTPERE